MADEVTYQGPYSVSALERFDTCPQAFRFGRIDRLPGGTSVPRQVGRAAHALLEAYVRHLVKQGAPYDHDALAELVIAVGAGVGGEAAGDFHEAIVPQVERLAFPVDRMADVRVEHRYAFDRDWKPCDWRAPGVHFRGVVDLSYFEPGLLVVDDWKTDRKLPPQSEIDSSLQLEVYAWMLAQAFPDVDEILIRLRFLRYGGAERKRKITRAELVDTHARVAAKIARIEAERRFEATPSSLCSWCEYRNVCPAFKALNDGGVLQEIDTPEQAALALQQRVMRKAELEALDERLRAWVDARGAIPLGDGKVYGYRAQPRLSFDDAAAVGNVLSGLGVPRERILEAFSATKAAIKRALTAAGFRGKALTEALRKVEAAGTESVQTKLELHDGEE